jgi:hypothetical protein
LLPAKTYSISSYSYRDPQSAWRGLNNTVASQFDTLGSILLGRLLSAWLNRYGIEDPDHFLQAIGPEFVSASLDDRESGTVTVVEVRDEKTLRDFVGKRLGPKPRSEMIGDAEMLVSNNEKRDAASFVGRHLLLGKADNIRLCLESRRANQTLASSVDFKKTTENISSSRPSIAVTYTDDRAPARNFIKAMAAQLAVGKQSPNEEKLNNELEQLRYAVSEMRLVEGGFERITSSSFGQFGMLAAQFSPSEN